ncbi:hypothetical protein [Tenacibaculum dicentrarchi]|uniref:hypothetical protein n=1 Tax=Tenacibaculum dicentrarchi TaxID=669041 RepID=UPI001BEC7898|nr:hypothetical protein [Tenacibaculum dicentrarchi]MCD8438044.1 hypothetical protein [Tenacibaculum dicentrarchi]MCD8443089.1 hypothetical protein [Tenacibaculum dicentrarchi]
MNIKTDKERIEFLLDYLKLSRNALGVSIGETNGSKFNHIVSGRNGISENLARKITNKFPEINYKWLLNGIGEATNLRKDYISYSDDNKIDVDVIVDVILSNEDKFNENIRFKKYLESLKNKAIIEYQERLISDYKKKLTKS